MIDLLIIFFHCMCLWPEACDKHPATIITDNTVGIAGSIDRFPPVGKVVSFNMVALRLGMYAHAFWVSNGQ